MLNSYRIQVRTTRTSLAHFVSFQHLMFVKHRNKEIPKQVRNDNCTKKCAFTLAEVLITLVIIGIVAALTIPNLMQKYTEQTTVKKVQKFYSNLSNAYVLAMKENGYASDWGLTGADTASAEKIYEILFKPYFKITKDCGIDNKGNCIANVTYKRLNNKNEYNYSSRTNHYKIMLDDGSAVWFRGNDDTRYDIDIYLDINGHKGPNQWGRDLFDFAIKGNKAVPFGNIGGNLTRCATNDTGYGCPAWVVYKGNMDYLHCDDLSWTGKDKCK